MPIFAEWGGDCCFMLSCILSEIFMKIVIAGAGEVGSYLSKMLNNNENNELTVIEPNEARLAKLAEEADILPVYGSPTSISVLEKADVGNSDLFIAVSPAQDQDVNLLSAILAKKMGSKKVTARINNDEYLSYDNKLFFTELGIDLLFYPEYIAAIDIIDLLSKTGTSEYMSFSNGALQLIVFRLGEDAPITGKKLSDLDFYNYETPYRTVAVSRAEGTIIPHGDFVFRENDLVFVISKKEGIKDAIMYSGKDSFEIKNLMIIGGGRIGEIVAKKMEKRLDYLKIIELRNERCMYLSDVLEKSLVMNGDGRNIDLLMEEDMRKCDAVVAVTSSSEANILACVAAKRAGVPQTIAEVENIEYIKLAESMGVDAVINKKHATAGRIFRFTISNKIRSVKCLNGSDAEVVEYIANPDSAITRAPIKDLKLPADSIIGGIIRGNAGIIAHGNTVVNPYDRVVVFALPHALNKLNKLFV